jgi:hypothetical protein
MQPLEMHTLSKHTQGCHLQTHFMLQFQNNFHDIIVQIINPICTRVFVSKMHGSQ